MKKEEFDPEVYDFYKASLEGNGFRANLDNLDIEMLREIEIKSHAWHLDPYEVHEKRDIMISRSDEEDLWVRVYVPDAVREEGGKLPVLLYFHGGGFIMGSIEDHDPLCGKLADECHAIVFAAEYRLAPEHQFPACIEDAVFTAEWAREHAAEFGGDPERILAGGDSSGANISAALALLGRDGKAPAVSGLILFYGTYGCIGISGSESARLYGQGDYVLPVNTMEKMMELYIPEGTDQDDYRLNPGRAEDLSNMPPAALISGGLDPLRDDGEEFARRLEAAGNRVWSIRADGMMHGFMLYWQRFSRAKELLERTGEIVRTWSE